MNNPFSKPKGILYLERTGFKFFMSKKNISAKLEFEKGTFENLEYVNQGRLDTQIAKFVSKYQLEPTTIIVVLSDSVIFSKKYTIKSLDKNTHAINDFLDELPFVPDQIVYKSFELGYEPGKAIAVATNINVYIGIVGSFSRLGWKIRAIVPEVAIGVVGVSVASIAQILHDKKMLNEADFLKSTPDNILNKVAPDTKKSKNSKKEDKEEEKESKDEVNTISSLAFSDSPSTKDENSGVVGQNKKQKKDKKGNSSPLFIPIVIVISLLIIGMGIFVLVKRSKDNKITTPEPTSGPALPPGPPQEEENETESTNIQELSKENIGTDTSPSLDTPKVVPTEEDITYLTKAALSIRVLNGTGVTGLAGSTKSAIETLEYPNISVGNAEDPFVDTTYVYYAEDVSPDHVNEIKNALEETFTNVVTEESTTLGEFSIEVVTGALSQ